MKRFGVGSRKDKTIQPNIPGYGKKSPKRYPSNRVCKNQECHTLLSVYNPLEYCSLHAPRRKKPRVRGVKVRMAEDDIREAEVWDEQQCESCYWRSLTWGAQAGETILIGGIAHVETSQPGYVVLCEVP